MRENIILLPKNKILLRLFGHTGNEQKKGTLPAEYLKKGIASDFMLISNKIDLTKQLPPKNSKGRSESPFVALQSEIPIGQFKLRLVSEMQCKIWVRLRHAFEDCSHAIAFPPRNWGLSKVSGKFLAK